jgi:hypothetical protein
MADIFRNFMAGRQQALDERQIQRKNALADMQLQREEQSRNALANYAGAAPDKRDAALDQLFAADPNTGVQASQFQQSRQNAVRTREQDLAGENARKAQFVLADPTNAVEIFKKESADEYAQLSQQAGRDLTPDEVVNLARRSLAHWGPRAGMSPGSQADVGPLESIVGPDGKPVFATRGQAVGKTPFAAGGEGPSMQLVTRPAAGGMVQDFGYNPKTNSMQPVGQPYKPAAGEDKSFTMANTLRDEFTNQTKDYGTIQASYNNIKATAKTPSAAGDIALLTSYMKMIDPGSTVREGEFATAQNASSVPEKARATYNQLLTGERLTPAIRNDFVNQAGNIFKSRDTQYKVTRKRYENHAKRAGLNPIDVIGEDAPPETPTGGEPASGAEPTATGQNGEKIAFRNGQWVPM